jgi:hypothetical protein
VDWQRVNKKQLIWGHEHGDWWIQSVTFRGGNIFLSLGSVSLHAQLLFHHIAGPTLSLIFHVPSTQHIPLG